MPIKNTHQIDFPGENIGLIHTKSRNLNRLQHKIYTRKCNTHKKIQAKEPNSGGSPIPHHTVPLNCHSSVSEASSLFHFKE